MGRLAAVFGAGFLFAMLGAAGCGGAGKYGYDVDYAPIGDEDDLMEETTFVTYEDVRRSPKEYQKALLGWFGVVEYETPAGEGKVTVVLTFRTLQPRNLCASFKDDTSCRVTVSEKPGGAFVTTLTLKAADEGGPGQLAIGSLVKVYGHPTGEVDAEGAPVLEAKWYRQWPRKEYVTTGAAKVLRQ